MMDEAPASPLEAARREIESIDAALLALLERRFGAEAKVRAASAGQDAALMPARDALVLRRLVEEAGNRLPPEVVVQVWRTLLAASRRLEGRIAIHGGQSLTGPLRDLVLRHYPDIPIVSHASDGAALQAASLDARAVAAVATEGWWLADLAPLNPRPEAFEALPSLADGGPPSVLLFGLARSEPTGADETVVATSGQLPRDFVPGPLWSLEAGGRRLTSLPGFLLEEQVPLVGLKSSNAPLALMVIGRYPSPIETS